MRGLNGCRKRHVPCRTTYVVHKRLPEQVWVLCGSSTGTVHHILLPGMGTAPWIVNSEIYPLRYRHGRRNCSSFKLGFSNLIVSETFLTLTEAVGSAGTFLLFAGFSAIGLIAIFFLVPETKGLAFEEVERMLAKGFKPRLFCMSKDDDDEDEK
ncbi:UNVERIFIED_CONTAM: putative inositol transporter 3 [Sesamum radiatum]|uniref:Inositol transporter 3 n=1 Tax=Sesamum radiatum TaxID=300843 RepID=A0AAW2KHM9_SESRA